MGSYTWPKDETHRILHDLISAELTVAAWSDGPKKLYAKTVLDKMRVMWESRSPCEFYRCYFEIEKMDDQIVGRLFDEAREHYLCNLAPPDAPDSHDESDVQSACDR